MAVKIRQVKHSAANGYMKAVNSSLDFEMDETLRDFRSLNTHEARAAFADKWLHLASSTLNRTWPMVYELLRIVRDDQIYLKGDWLETREAYADFSGYFESVIGQPFDTWADLEKTYHFAEQYKPGLFKGSFEDAKQARIQEEVAESKSRPLMAEHGGERWEMTRTEDGTKLAKKDDVQVDNVNLNIEDNSPPKGGNKLSYLTDRLRTQHPEVFAALERGEYPSVHAAAVDAGIRKPMAQHTATVNGFLNSIRKHLTDDQIRELREKL